MYSQLNPIPFQDQHCEPDRSRTKMAAVDPVESAGGPGCSQSPGILRKAVPGEKRALKEKIIGYYESILKVE